MGKLVALALVGLLVSVLGSGCSLVPGPGAAPSGGAATSGGPVPGGGAETCVDWVRFETPQDQYDKAGVVLIGKSVSRTGETSIYGYKATTHLVEVEQVLKGDPGDGNLRISSMPPTCTGGETYPDGDPLDPNQRVIIFATRQGGDWFTMTPAQGVLPFPQGTKLPFH
ncbi:hypothetical protein [Arthrobacter oryzae]|uniref:hypothetical protein n=1 Tax=Arthrobacter oryzae TaxID=409290 RepID=UPI00277E5753|nr:hypothetical protein [Arthrobacter oryzae]MDQ0076322.1 hypothetical protein [Arthrobacter oryzae]